MTEVVFPHNGWSPRRHQEAAWDALDDGAKRAIIIAHRRFGKDELALHWAACAAYRRPGTYYHMLPAANQARRAVFEAVNEETGVRRIHEAFPAAAIKRIRENEMAIDFKNGSQWAVVGSDNYESLIGTSPVGLIYSEWSLSRPESYLYLSPIIERNGGTAIFITTPRGPQNHATEMYHKYKDDPLWFSQVISAADTDVFSPADLQRIKDDLILVWGDDMGASLFDQEYLCSLNSSVMSGTYFSREMDKLDAEGRIGNVPYDPRYKVYTSWDIGVHDVMVCLCWQLVGKAIHLIDQIDHTDVGFDWFAKELDKKGYSFASHLLPHDGANREIGAPGARSRIDSFRTLGLVPAQVVPRQNDIDEGIYSVRSLLADVYIDKTKCRKTIEALRKYHRVWSNERRAFSEKPAHDWTSHYVDSVRTFATADVNPVEHRPIKYKRRGIV